MLKENAENCVRRARSLRGRRFANRAGRAWTAAFYSAWVAVRDTNAVRPWWVWRVACPGVV